MELFEVVSYEVLPTDEIYPLYFDFPEHEMLNERFERMNYDSYYSIMGLGFLLIIIVWLLALYPIYFLLWLCRLRCRWPENIMKWLWSTLFWKQWILFVDASFLELTLVVLLQAQIAHEHWLLNVEVLASYIFWIFVIVLILGLIFITFFVVLPKYAKEGKTKQQMDKYGFLLDEMSDLGGISPILVHFSYYFRRIIFAIVCVYYNEHQLFQLMVIQSVDLLSAVIQAHFRPGNGNRGNNILFLNDLTLIMSVDCLFCCTDLLTVSSARYAVGYLIIAVCWLYLVVNMFLLSLDPVEQIRLRLLWCYAVRQKRRGKAISYLKHRSAKKFTKSLVQVKSFLSSTNMSASTGGSIKQEKVEPEKSEPQKPA